MPRLPLVPGLLLAPLLACAPAAPPDPIEPAEGPSSGYFPILVDLSATAFAPEEVAVVRVGTIDAYGPRPTEDGRLEVTVQGHPTPGPVDVTVAAADGRAHTFEGAFTYLPAAAPEFERLVAFGASLSQGVQGGTPNHDSILMSPPAQLARAAGAWFPLPVFVPDLFPSITAEDVGPPPECDAPGVRSFVTAAAAQVLVRMIDPATGLFTYSLGRVDPALPPHNLAVGGFRIADVVHGPPDGAFEYTFLGHLVLEPFGDPAADLVQTQLERIEELRPTLVVSGDFYGNDLILPLIEPEEVDLDLLTSTESFAADLEELVERLAATGAQVFLGDIPLPSVLPAARGKEGPALDEVDARTRAFNSILREVCAEYPNVHVVDQASVVDELARGIEVGGELLTNDRFGGLLSLDDLHFTDTGYALVADRFRARIAEELDLELAPVPIGAVLAQDELRPSALRAAGIDPEACGLR